MTAESFEVTERRPYAGGRLFGEFGPFEISQGRIHYAVDPESPRNAAVVDLAHAPRDDDGKVRFQGEFTFINTVVGGAGKPARTLLIDVPNRGRRLSFSMFNRARPEDLQGDPCAPGDGFLFERGFAVASIGCNGASLGASASRRPKRSWMALRSRATWCVACNRARTARSFRSASSARWPIRQRASLARGSPSRTPALRAPLTRGSPSHTRALAGALEVPLARNFWSPTLRALTTPATACSSARTTTRPR
ncbi:MAG: hypothetical protein F4Y86_06195 [Gammaproteobacteria bacterium]|nr:hypothetical protein [Gammaproteobacteria bacterium]